MAVRVQLDIVPPCGSITNFLWRHKVKDPPLDDFLIGHSKSFPEPAAEGVASRCIETGTAIGSNAIASLISDNGIAQCEALAVFDTQSCKIEVLRGRAIDEIAHRKIEDRQLLLRKVVVT